MYCKEVESVLKCTFGAHACSILVCTCQSSLVNSEYTTLKCGADGSRVNKLGATSVNILPLLVSADWEAETPTSLFKLEGCPDASIRRHHSAFQQDHVDLHLQAQCISSFASQFLQPRKLDFATNPSQFFSKLLIACPASKSGV